MTIEISIKCDANGCHREAEIRSESDHDIESAGYTTDPRHDEYHYCAKCWPEVKKEISEE